MKQEQIHEKENEPYFCTYFQGDEGHFAPDVVASLGGTTFNHQSKAFIL